jgi:hypothetical protein
MVTKDPGSFGELCGALFGVLWYTAPRWVELYDAAGRATGGDEALAGANNEQ